MKNKNAQKKIALINDFTGYGRCSIAVQLPIISALKVQCCPVPTAMLSNHTGFESYFIEDLTANIPHYIDEWKKLNLNFDGICSGYLGSVSQIDMVEDFFKHFKTDTNVIIVDPVMGDNGKIYSSFSEEIPGRIKELIKYANIITPNLTEACIITNTPYKEKMSKKELSEIALKLHKLGPEKVVITGVQNGRFIANYCSEIGHEAHLLKTTKVGTGRPGTGDVFASIIAADGVNGVPFEESVKKASGFVKKCIIKAMECDTPVNEGVPFEMLLTKLK